MAKIPAHLIFFIMLELLLAAPEVEATTRILASAELVRFGEEGGSAAFQPAGERPLKLIAAGNETVFVQIAVAGDLVAGESITLAVSPLAGQGKIAAAAIAADRLRAFAVEDCLDGQFAPDCLVPMTGNTALINEHDRKLGYKTIWVDIATPSSQLPGFYQGTIAARAGDNGAIIPLSLMVLPFALPGLPSLKADLNNYGVGFTQEFGLAQDSDAGIAMTHEFHRLARSHGMTLNPLPYRSQLGEPHEAMAPALSGQGDGMRVSDWSGFDRHYGPLLDGSAFPDGRPLDHQYLPFNPDWPSSFDNYLGDRKRYEAEWAAIGREFVNHLKGKNWASTEFQIYLNQKPREYNKIPWTLDEPRGRADYKALRYYADLTHKAFAGAEPGRFNFRLDISHFYCDKHRWEFAKDFRINNGAAILAPTDVWVIAAHSLEGEAAREKAARLRADGKTVFEYYPDNRMPLVTAPLNAGRQYGWRAWRGGFDGILFWNTVKKRDKVSDGRDFLIYPGVTKGFQGPLASLRLKSIQRGMQDYEYLRLAAKRYDISKITNFTSEAPAAVYEQARQKLAAAIHGSFLLKEGGRK